MARAVNGFVGTFDTVEALTAKYDPAQHAGCSANVGTGTPYTKAWSDGVVWYISLTASQVAALGASHALRAWRMQPKSYQLAAIPTPTHHIDFNRGNDSTGDGSKAAPYKTLQKMQTVLPAAGSCIALANDSTFDLTDRLTFSASGSTALNGSSDAVRLTWTNYDPGGYPTQRPRIRFRYVPTSGQWVWDATFQAWYYANPYSRTFTRSALMRLGGVWGSQEGYEGPAMGVGVLTRDYQCYSEDTLKRMYVYAPAGTDPTTYYGGAGSVILGEGEGGALAFSRCGNFVTVDGITFEECGIGVLSANFSASADIEGLIVQRCAFLNVGRAIYAVADSNSSYTTSAKILQNTLVGGGAEGIHTYCKAKDWEIAGNYADDLNNSWSAGGLLYSQEGSTGTTAHGNNLFHENYMSRAKFYRGNAPYDGAGCYLEVRAKGWTVARNFFTKSHHGVFNNSGTPQVVTTNVFDDVDIAYCLSDAGGINQTDSTFTYNTVVNSSLTKYQTAGSINPNSALVSIFASVSGTAVVNHKNNIFHSLVMATAQKNAGTGTISGGYNHLCGKVASDVTTSTGAMPAQDGTTFGIGYFTDDYIPLEEISPGIALDAQPSPADVYGIRNALPIRGAVNTWS